MSQYPNDAADIDQITSEMIDELIAGASTDEETLPVIGPEIYDRLPARLRRLCDTMEEGVERAVFLTSALPVLAGFLVNVRGRCGDGLISLCLYSMVYGLAGSGKGALRHARRLGEATDIRLSQESRDERARWQVSRDAGTPSDTPEPPERRFFAAGNSSAAAMADTISDNGGRAVLCESEMASITVAMGQDWGRAVADLLLRCYQGEPILIDRKTDSIRIIDPALCVAMTGTPASLATLLPSAESGLLSRCMIYQVDPPPRWISQAPTDLKTERDDLIREEGRALDDLYAALAGRSEVLAVHMTPDQWDYHTGRFTKELERLCATGLPRTMEAAVKRAGNNAFRLACTLAVLRTGESGGLATAESVMVKDEEAMLGIDLAMIYLAHSIEFAATLSTNAGFTDARAAEKAAWCAALPEEFKTTEAVALGGEAGIPERTIKRWIQELVKAGPIERVMYGVYRRVTGGRTSPPQPPTNTPKASRGRMVEGVI